MSEFKPPSDNPTFVRYWNIFIPEITSRKNFNQGHLEQLRILCEMLDEVEELRDDIKMNGYSFISHGRNGEQEKIRPQVSVLHKMRGEIRSYCRMLNLVIDKGDGKPSESDQDDWG